MTVSRPGSFPKDAVFPRAIKRLPILQAAAPGSARRHELNQGLIISPAPEHSPLQRVPGRQIRKRTRDTARVCPAL